MLRWKRVRFNTAMSIPRSTSPGPYWHDIDIIRGKYTVGFFPIKCNVLSYWPDATELNVLPVQEITFTTRNPRPRWWKGEGKDLYES